MLEPLKHGLVGTLAAFKNALLPLQCLICKSFIQTPSHRVSMFHPHRVVAACPSEPGERKRLEPLRAYLDELMAECLCESCRSAYQPVQSPLCTVCGRMFPSRVGEDHLCGDCIETPKHYHKARAAAVSTPGLIEIIHRFKYNRKLQLAKPFGCILLLTFCECWPDRDIQALLPVPLHIERLRQRGFNQAYLLVRAWQTWGEKFDLGLADMRIDKTTLRRKHRTQPQTGLGRAQRHQNVKKAFTVSNPENVRDKTVLLLDDVYTTGATINECARVLKQSGAARVDVLTLARAM